MKNMILPVAIFVAILGCVLAVSANVTTTKMNEDLEQERYQRMLTEEQLQKSQNQVVALKKELTESRSKIASIEKILNLGQTTTRTLEDKLKSSNAERKSLQGQISKLQKQLSRQIAAPTPPAP